MELKNPFEEIVKHLSREIHERADCLEVAETNGDTIERIANGCAAKAMKEIADVICLTFTGTEDNRE